MNNLITAVLLALVLIGASPAKAHDKLYIGKPNSVEGLFCDTKEQLLSLLTEGNENGFEAAEKLRVTLKNPEGGVACHVSIFVMFIQETSGAFTVNGDAGVFVKGIATTVYKHVSDGQSEWYQIPEREQYFWTPFEVVEEKPKGYAI